MPPRTVRLAVAWLLAALAAGAPGQSGPAEPLAPQPPTAARTARSGPAALPDLPLLRDPARWQVQPLGLGVELRRGWFGALFGRPQSLAVLELDLTAPGVSLRLAVPDRRTPTSRQGRGAGALAAVNGGFFGLEDGRPLGFRQLQGTPLGRPYQPPRAAVGWRGAAVQFARGDADWTEWPEVIEAGPQVLRAGEVVDHGARQRSIRHPRTAFGQRADGRVLLLVADGRMPPAGGLSLEELGAVLRALGCRDAVNLDGGGSTTLWARGFSGGDGSGIANHPCDDRRFDAGGERAVADVLLVDARAVVQGDDLDAAWLGPVAELRDAAGALDGACQCAAAGAAVAGTWRLLPPRPGRYAVQRRGVRVAGLAAAAAWQVRAGGAPVAAAELPADAAAGDGWATLGELAAAPAAPVEVVAGPVAGLPFAADAVRLLELPVAPR